MGVYLGSGSLISLLRVEECFFKPCCVRGSFGNIVLLCGCWGLFCVAYDLVTLKFIMITYWIQLWQLGAASFQRGTRVGTLLVTTLWSSILGMELHDSMW